MPHSCAASAIDDVDRVRLERREQAHDARPAGLSPLDALVDRPHVLPRPAVGAEIRPRVEVRGCAANPDHRVEAARAAEDAAARPREPASVGVRLRHGLVGPVDLGEPELVEPPGIVDRGVLVAPTGLEQEDAAAPPSIRRRATTAPADPAPTTMTSALRSLMKWHVQTLAQPAGSRQRRSASSHSALVVRVRTFLGGSGRYRDGEHRPAAPPPPPPCQGALSWRENPACASVQE